MNLCLKLRLDQVNINQTMDLKRRDLEFDNPISPTSKSKLISSLNNRNRISGLEDTSRNRFNISLKTTRRAPVTNRGTIRYLPKTSFTPRIPHEDETSRE